MDRNTIEKTPKIVEIEQFTTPKEINFGKKKYILSEDDEKVHLTDTTRDGIKINISFSKNPTNNQKAKDGLNIFFTGLYS